MDLIHLGSWWMWLVGVLSGKHVGLKQVDSSVYFEPIRLETFSTTVSYPGSVIFRVSVVYVRRRGAGQRGSLTEEVRISS